MRCLCAAEEVKKMSQRMEEVEESDVPVVSEAYLEVASKGAALLSIPGSTISEWGATRHSLPAQHDKFGKSFKSKGQYI